MAISNVTSGASATQTYNTNTNSVGKKKTTQSEAAQNETAASSTNSTDKAEEQDSYISDKKYTPDTDKVNAMIKEAEQKMSSFINMVEKLVLKQGSTFSNIFGAIRKGQFEVDEETIKKAQEDVSEDGYYGVKQTSQRIFDFAYAITGGDPSKIEEMREAVQKGFDSAEKLWGGELPEISKQTYDAVMKKFDEWAEQSKATDETGNVSNV